MEFLRSIFLMTSLALYIFIGDIDAVKVDGPTQDLINSICTEIEDYDLCNKIIHDELKTPTANLKQLTDLIFHLAIEYASDTYIFIGNILRGLPGPKETTCLESCLAVYNIETDIFVQIRFEFSKKEYERMIITILSTTKILKKCRTDFQIPPNKENPLIEKNRVMRILIAMSAVSGYMVEKDNASLLSSVVAAVELSEY